MKLATVTIVHPADRTKKLVINELDYDQKTHLLWDDHVKKALKKEAAAEKKKLAYEKKKAAEKAKKLAEAKKEAEAKKVEKKAKDDGADENGNDKEK